MKLYTFPASPNCIKVMALAHQMGIDLEQVVVDLTKGEQRNPEFLALNPNGKIPTLQDGDFVLWESNAIMQYLADKHGPTDLWPQGLQARADISRWLHWHDAHWGHAIGTLLWERFVKGIMQMGEPDARAVEEGMQYFRQFAGVLNGHLAGRSFVTGEKPTLADLCLASPLVYSQQAGLPVAEFPNVQAWFGRVMALDSFRKALPPMPAGV